jgi:S-adenosylmethionine:tRNA ribosyltransferase-isomerase
MVLDRGTGETSHRDVSDLPTLLDPGDLLLLNDTRVIPARLFAKRTSGRRFELLLLRRLASGRWQALLRPSARARPGEDLELADGGVVRPLEALGDGQWTIDCEPELDLERLERLGETPLPPYIERPDGATPADRERYQTVFARVPGAVAAPTAGLHLTRSLLDAIRGRGVETAFATLHVGIGTFRPVSVANVGDHVMDAEWYRFGEVAARAVNGALDQRRRVVCVGTTSVRALEGALAAGDGRVAPGEGWTDIFITPGYRFRGVGALMTNFHLPRSTLLMLVSALAGRERMLAAYREAVAMRYRFFSYGDAMLVR